MGEIKDGLTNIEIFSAETGVKLASIVLKLDGLCGQWLKPIHQGVSESVKWLGIRMVGKIMILDLETNEVKTIRTEITGKYNKHTYGEVVFSGDFVKTRKNMWNCNTEERPAHMFFQLFKIPSGEPLFKSLKVDNIDFRFDVEKGVCHFFRYRKRRHSKKWTIKTFNSKGDAPKLTYGKIQADTFKNIYANQISIAFNSFVSMIENKGEDLSLVVQPFPSGCEAEAAERKVRPFLALENNNKWSCPKLYCTHSKAVVATRKADLKSNEFVLLDFNI